VSLLRCPHCATMGLGENALAKHVERRHTGPSAPYVIVRPGEPRPVVVYYVENPYPSDD